MASMSDNSTRFRNLDLNLLVSLDALLTERSVTRAGERVFRSQSTMSGILSKLRFFFGDELLIRVGNRIELTPIAEQLIEPLREFIAAAQNISSFRPTVDPKDLEHIFVIAMSDYSADFILPTLMKMLIVEAPRVRLRVRSTDYDYWSSLEARETDFVILPSETVEARWPAEEILTDRWVCIADAKHHRENTLPIDAFVTYPMIAVNYYDGLTQMSYERQLNKAGIRYSSIATIPYFQTLPRLISGSPYLAIIHERTALRHREEFGLKIFNLPFTLNPLRLSLVTHDRNFRSQPHGWFKSLVHGACAQLRGSPK